MAIRKFYVAKPKDGYQYDRKEGKYFSWGYDIWLDRQRISERGFFTKDQAETAVKSLREDAKNERYGIAGKQSSPQLIELFQKKLDSLHVRRDRTRAKRVFTYFLKLLPAGIKVAELKTAHLNSYLEARTADGVKNSTIKREMVPIVEVLNNADQYFGELEGYRPPRKPKLSISKIRKTVTIGVDARRKLLSHLLEPQKPGEKRYQAASRRRVGLFLQFCLLTVSRPGEIAALRHSDVDLANGVIRITGTKTQNKSHSVRELIITPTMKAILAERSALDSAGGYVFTRGGYVTEKMRHRLKEACEAVGIKYGKNEKDGITFYTARHTATSELIRSGVDLRTAGKFTGHSDETMTLYYSHGDRHSLELAAEVLEKNMGSKLYDGEFLEPVADLSQSR